MNIGILGCGAFGTALALRLRETGHEVRGWARDPGLAEEVRRGRNEKYLPGLPFDGFDASASLADLRGADLHVLAVPTSAYRDIAPSLASLAPQTLVSTAKGIDATSLEIPSAIVAGALGPVPYGVLTGPSFAVELAAGAPTALVAASRDAALAERIQVAFSGPTLRVYASDDVAGCELAGALKNVVAIAAGMAAGLGLGQNTHAALVTRGLSELSRLVVAFGGRTETASGLAGLGDLVLTCGSPLSRNLRFGRRIAEGADPRAALLEIGTVEGYPTARAARDLAARHGIEMPIAAAVAGALFDGLDVRAAVSALMLRKLKREVH